MTAQSNANNLDKQRKVYAQRLRRLDYSNINEYLAALIDADIDWETVGKGLADLIDSSVKTTPGMEDAMKVSERVHIGYVGDGECRNTTAHDDMNNGVAQFKCSKCGCELFSVDEKPGAILLVRDYDKECQTWVEYCPKCGRHVVR